MAFRNRLKGIEPPTYLGEMVEEMITKMKADLSCGDALQALNFVTPAGQELYNATRQELCDIVGETLLSTWCQRLTRSDQLKWLEDIAADERLDENNVVVAKSSPIPASEEEAILAEIQRKEAEMDAAQASILEHKIDERAIARATESAPRLTVIAEVDDIDESPTSAEEDGSDTPLTAVGATRKERGPAPEFYHFYSEQPGCHRRLEATICLLNYGIWCLLGMAICSPRDTPSRARGRQIAQGRAIKQRNKLTWAMTEDEAYVFIDFVRYQIDSDPFDRCVYKSVMGIWADMLSTIAHRAELDGIVLASLEPRKPAATKQTPNAWGDKPAQRVQTQPRTQARIALTPTTKHLNQLTDAEFFALMAEYDGS